MSSCKDCINYDVCSTMSANCDRGSAYCSMFKDKSKFIELPCKVGDTVYTNFSMSGWYLRKADRPYKAKVVFIGINGEDNFLNVEIENGKALQFFFSSIGKTVFLTREQAEKALEERENNG